MEESDGKQTPQQDKMEQINNADLMHIRKLAKSSNPPVSLAKCQTIEEQRERLRCAYRKEQGTAKNIDAFGNLMDDLKESDRVKREQLVAIFQRLSDVANAFEKLDDNFHEHLGIQEDTRDIFCQLHRFETSLNIEECPIVVAGQVSAGKSTLLNLFLGQDILPNQLLSCTATICELAYSPTPKAELLLQDGTTKTIPFEEKNNYIYKDSERDEGFKHKSVKISMPVAFLKSGVTLVDTPGVGENVIMGQQLPDYVRTHDVFGFIFVVKCDDSGGILIRFKEMIRTLAAIKDQRNQYKFEPRSAIFIANFWDKVPDEDKTATKKKIIQTLENEPCLNGFDPDEQLFFLNSLFALNTWKVGLISEDFDKVISAIENFFPKGHQRKLEKAYSWLELVVIILMHQVDGLVAKESTPLDIVESSTDSVRQALQQTIGRVQHGQNELESALESARKSLQSSIQHFLRSPEASKALTAWRLGEIPKEEYGDTWILLEERLDNAIHNKISLALQNWEVEQQLVYKEEEEIILLIHKRFTHIVEELEDIGKGARTTTKVNMPKTYIKCQRPIDQGEGVRKFKVNEELFGNEGSYISQLCDSLFPSRSLLFLSDRLSRLQQRQKDITDFQQDRVKFMSKRSEGVLQALSTDSKFVSKLVDDQLNLASQNIANVIKKTNENIKYIKTISEDILKKKRENCEWQYDYKPLRDDIHSLLDQCLAFKYTSLEEYHFNKATIKDAPKPTATGTGPMGCFGAIYHRQHAGKNVTVKELPIYMRRRHIFFMKNQLQMLSKMHSAGWWASVLGIMQQDIPGIIMDSLLMTARSNMFQKGNTFRTELGREKEFITYVTEALNFLHIKKLVHMEVSLDSILVDQHGTPKLSNIFEALPVPFPLARDGVKAGNYVYISPETFPIEGSNYTAASDMYGLGLLMIELLAQQDIYESMKNSLTLDALLSDPDPGAKLYHLMDHPSVDQQQIEFVKRCLHPNPWKRISLEEWINDLKAFDWPHIMNKF